MLKFYDDIILIYLLKSLNQYGNGYKYIMNRLERENQVNILKISLLEDKVKLLYDELLFYAGEINFLYKHLEDPESYNKKMDDIKDKFIRKLDSLDDIISSLEDKSKPKKNNIKLCFISI